eukprot:CAMPEP_0181083824 /NCGR_PEP_ID=MMETSP1071-20121207/4371_1 /TAXON_ID=35127 /ORGANISM="Thalassiosira sp., Strain NH16" /LENGTH=384 /DNA_ID=CAMNT_0023165523 /DNA_START=157 /DNA_END=1312 /DNA_ORIENTATION=+
MCAPPSSLLNNSSKNHNDVPPSYRITLVMTTLYVLSGVTQPLLMELAKQAGLADRSCQIYMQFYYLGTASVALPAWNDAPLSLRTTLKTASVAVIDIAAQTLNYSGATMAGPTIFAIVYSSVTIWCALLSRMVLGRVMTHTQWLGVFAVFFGLGITGMDSLDLGTEVARGTALVGIGSALHAFMYVASEVIMNNSSDGDGAISARKYCAIYGTVAFCGYLLWQLYYTRVHFDDLVLTPMRTSRTSLLYALAILLSIAAMSALHSITFFHTVKHVPGGSTSAGVLKALQAVLVFAATSAAFCHRVGGGGNVLYDGKMASLCVVVAGVVLFGRATEMTRGNADAESKGYGRVCGDHDRGVDKDGYKRIDSLSELEMEAEREYHDHA